MYKQKLIFQIIFESYPLPQAPCQVLGEAGNAERMEAATQRGIFTGGQACLHERRFAR